MSMTTPSGTAHTAAEPCVTDAFTRTPVKIDRPKRLEQQLSQITARYLKQLLDDVPLLLVRTMKHRHEVPLRHLLRRRVHVKPQKRGQTALRTRQQ